VHIIQPIYAQNEIDSLRLILLQEPNNPTIFNDLAYALIPDSITEGRAYAQKALLIAQQSDNLEEQGRALYTIGD